MGLYYKAVRAQKAERFAELFPIIRKQLNDQCYIRDNGSYSFIHPEMGTLDFYPKKNKLLIRKKNKWVTSGLEFLVKHFKLDLTVK